MPTAKKNIINAATCPVEMGDSGATLCGRPLHLVSNGVDVIPVCLMHSKDENKRSGRLLKEFHAEFEKILLDAEHGQADFTAFRFPECDFSNRKFLPNCNFSLAVFTGRVDFSHTTFTRNATFTTSTFEDQAIFSFASFLHPASFSYAEFKGEARFDYATFSQYAYFVDAVFHKDAHFSSATFKLVAAYLRTTFHGLANWEWCRFLDRVEFTSTRFNLTTDGLPAAVFVLAQFFRPGEIFFDDIDLSRTLFFNCDISDVAFTPSVRWVTRKNGRSLMIYEESLLDKPRIISALARYGRIDHNGVERIYQQLKKNYDKHLDYHKANDFHFGEMEMKRLAVTRSGKYLWLRRPMHRWFSMIAFYKYASDYGNNYYKPALLLILVLFATALILPFAGLNFKQPNADTVYTYQSLWNCTQQWSVNLWNETRLVGASVIASIDTATFQRNSEYTPAYPWGRMVAIVETLLTSTLFGLFLLAIRRRFRR